MIDQPSYYTVIPAYVRYDEDLLKRPKAILIYGEIVALSNQKGYCWASNKYFEERLGVSSRTVQDYLSLLIEKGYVRRKLVYKSNSKEIDTRILVVGYPPATDFTTPPATGNTTPPATDCADNTTRFKYTTTDDSEEFKTHPLAYYQVAYGKSPTGILSDELTKWSDSIGNEVTNYAIWLSARAGNGFNYARSILEGWQKDGVTSLAAAKENHSNYTNKQKAKNTRPEPQAFETEDKSKGKAKIIAEFYSKYHDIDRVISEIKSEYDTKLSREEVEKYVGNGAGS